MKVPEKSFHKLTVQVADSPNISDIFHPLNQENSETLYLSEGNKIFGLKLVYSQTHKTDALGKLQRTEH